MNTSPNDQASGASSLPREWDGLRRLVLKATEADIEHALITGRSVLVRQSPVEWPSAVNRLEIHVGSVRNVYWKTSQFFAVNADLDDLPQNRHILTYAYYHKGQGLLVLDIPDEAREALRGSVKVRIYRGDDTELKIKDQLKSAIDASTSGEVIASAFTSSSAVDLVPRSAPHLPKDRALNGGQQRALAAMTTAGGYFVWGPPGTGKTTVITSAVVDALNHGRSVLITSHTNVAVDNVLKGLVEDDADYSLGMMHPGRVIRHASDDGKVLPLVAEHKFLMTDKAAAMLVGRETRLAELQQAIAENRSHTDRLEATAVWAELDAAGVDVDAVIRAQDTQPRLVELRALRKALAEEISLHQSAEETFRLARQALSEVAGAKARLSAHDANVARSSKDLERAITRSNDLQGALGQAELSEELAASRLRSADLALQAAWLRFVPWERRRRAGQWELSRQELLAAEYDRNRLRGEHLNEAANIERLSAQLQELGGQRETLVLATAAEYAAEKHCKSTDANLLSAAERRRDLTSREAELCKGLTDPDAQERLTTQAQHDGTWYLVERHRSLTESVAALDEQLKQAEDAKKHLEDEYEKKRRELLQSAPVVACTLTALTFNPDLGGRRFDVVIIDEAASASAASVIYAGSRADRTVAIVGDFLQNAPINEIENPENDDERALARWRTADVFQLAGITDRRSADAHERCVALSKQYRYPPIIANTVNAFCYDGLLESNKSDNVSDGPVITFLDTSRAANATLSKSNGSWQCPFTAEQVLKIAERHPTDVGFVTPYAAQASLVSQMARKTGLNLPAGTAHKFQGREFETVIFDLMQDDKPRWVSAADLQGNARAISAAKLLNVSLTRAKKRIFLIGNWEFVRTHESPGMLALAELADHHRFSLKQL